MPTDITTRTAERAATWREYLRTEGKHAGRRDIVREAAGRAIDALEDGDVAEATLWAQIGNLYAQSA